MSGEEISLEFHPDWPMAKKATVAVAARRKPLQRRGWWPLVVIVAVALVAGGIFVVFADTIKAWISLPVMLAFVAGLYVMFGMLILKARVQWARLRRRWEAHQGRLGLWRVSFSARGYHIRTDVSEVRAGWVLVEDIFAMAGGTALLVGPSIIIVPDAGLPEGQDAKQFRARLEAWRTE